MDALALDPATTALVVIDLQRGIVSRRTAPHASGDVIARAARVASRFRAAKSTVVLVRVTPSSDGRDRLQPEADQPAPAGAAMPADFADIVPEMGPQAGDIIITKRQWGAFYGTELDLQLRRRGVRTIVLCGISTNIGVESTARDAFERGYDQIFVKDALASFSSEAHQFTVTTIFTRIGRVRSTEQVLAAISK
jgi:nicotinamidase-related amidase